MSDIKWKKSQNEPDEYHLRSGGVDTGFKAVKIKAQFQEVTLRRAVPEGEHPHPKGAYFDALEGKDAPDGREFSPASYKLVTETEYRLCYRGDRLVFNQKLGAVKNLGAEAQRLLAEGCMLDKDISMRKLQEIALSMMRKGLLDA